MLNAEPLNVEQSLHEANKRKHFCEGLAMYAFVCVQLRVCQGVERAHVCKALWMCVILGDRVCLGLCM